MTHKGWCVVKHQTNKQTKLITTKYQTLGESDKLQENTPHKRAKRSALSQQVIALLQGTDKTA